MPLIFYSQGGQLPPCPLASTPLPLPLSQRCKGAKRALIFMKVTFHEIKQNITMSYISHTDHLDRILFIVEKLMKFEANYSLKNLLGGVQPKALFVCSLHSLLVMTSLALLFAPIALPHSGVPGNHIAIRL